MIGPGRFVPGGVRAPPGATRRPRGRAPGGARTEHQMLEAYIYYLEMGLPVVLALIAGLALSKLFKSI